MGDAKDRATGFGRRSESDEALMDQLARGDLRALGTLFIRHERDVHALCQRLAGGSGAADDLVQETFLRVFRYRAGFRGEARFSTWLYRIARNICYDHLAAEGRRRSTHEASEAPEAPPGTSALAGVPDEDRLEALRGALLSLSFEKREVLVLSRYHDLSYAEIARICGCSVAAVKVRVHRALKELRAHYTRIDRERNEL